MRVIIAGCRDHNNMASVEEAITESGFEITEVVSGAAKGVDTLGEQWAYTNRIPVKQFPAEWNLYGVSAGPRRNYQMAQYADALIAIWDGISRGTNNMIENANRKGMPVYIYRLNKG